VFSHPGDPRAPDAGGGLRDARGRPDRPRGRDSPGLTFRCSSHASPPTASVARPDFTEKMKGTERKEKVRGTDSA
jgi:hypothetical protein